MTFQHSLTMHLYDLCLCCSIFQVWIPLIGLTPLRNYAYSGQEARFPLVIRVFVVSYIYIVDSYSLTSCKRLLFYT
jgi:hypothetical protein